MRNLILASLLAMTAMSASPVLAANTPAAYSTAETSIGDLLDNPEAKAIVDKHMPGFSTNPQVDMARGMTFKQIQQFAPDQMKDETLAQIDADLAKLAAKAK